MNALLNRFLFIALMIFGALNLGNAVNLPAMEDGGEMVTIDKTGNSYLTISLSKDFFKSEDQLITPAVVTLSVGDKVLLETQSASPYLEISGIEIDKGTTLVVHVTIGDFHFVEKLTW